MKKLTPLLFALSMSTSLIACSNNEPSLSSKDESSLVQEQDQTSQKEDKNSQEKHQENKITFSEHMAIDNEYCSIKFIDLQPDRSWGYSIKAQLENKSADKKYMFAIDSAAIDGVSVLPIFATEVAPGKKALKNIEFSDQTLKDNGVDDFTDIEMSFRVYDSDDWTADPVARETVHVYPYGEDKATKFVRKSQPNDTILVDNDQITAIVTGYDEDGTFGYTVNLYFVNKTDQNIMFAVQDASINGFMIDPFYAKSVPAGQSAFSSMHWSDQTLDENEISTIEQIDFTLNASDADDWLASDILNQSITLKP